MFRKKGRAVLGAHAVSKGGKEVKSELHQNHRKNQPGTLRGEEKQSEHHPRRKTKKFPPSMKQQNPSKIEEKNDALILY